MKRLILASASPRRQLLLSQAGFAFDIMPSEVDENLDESVSAYDTVKNLSNQKAMAVLNRVHEPAVIIAADTIVSIHGRVLGKPRQDEEARAMLRLLQGQTHTVYTGVTLINQGQDGYELKQIVDNTNVTMRPLAEEEIDAYVRTGEPRDKAGAYGIQGRGSLFIERIDGDYFTVVGLPLVRVYLTLRTMGVELRENWTDQAQEEG